MKIGVLVPNTEPNPLYRVVMPMNELARHGHSVGSSVVPDESRLPPFEAFLDFDVVYIWRLYHAPIRRLVRGLRESGVAVVWDNDDDVSTVPKGAVNYREVGGIKGQRMWAETQAMVRLVDAVTTPSTALAARFSKSGQEHVHVIENYVPGVGPGRPATPGRVLVGWCALLEHSVDVKPLGVRAALKRVLDEDETAHVETTGVALGLENPRYRRLPGVPFAEMLRHVGRLDLGIAPLADTPFNRARSNVKLKEYAAGGVPWLASPIGPYAGMGEEQGGRLVEDGRWADEILALVRDAEARRELADRAHAWARTQTIRANVGEWERILEAAVARARVSHVGV